MPKQNMCSLGREGCDWPFATFHVCVDLSYSLPQEGLVQRRKPKHTNATHPKRRYQREKRWDE